MEQHTLQSVVAGEGQPAEQQLWHLKLLDLKVAERSLVGKQRSSCPTPRCPKVLLLRLFFTVPEAPPVASTSCFAQANSRDLGVLQAKGTTGWCWPGLEDSENQGSWTKQDVKGLSCLLKWVTDCCYLCCPPLPCTKSTLPILCPFQVRRYSRQPGCAGVPC